MADREQASQLLADWSAVALLVRGDTQEYNASTLFRPHREIATDDFGAAGTARARLMLERIRCGFAAAEKAGESEADRFWDRFRGILKDLEGRQGMLSPGIQLLYQESESEADVEMSDSSSEDEDPGLSMEYMQELP